jgi:hypothetical protein
VNPSVCGFILFERFANGVRRLDPRGMGERLDPPLNVRIDPKSPLIVRVVY